MVKNSPVYTVKCKGRGFNLWIRKIPWRRKWQPIPVFLPRASRGQRSPAGYSPEGREESDMTEQLVCIYVLYVWLSIHTINKIYVNRWLLLVRLPVNSRLLEVLGGVQRCTWDPQSLHCSGATVTRNEQLVGPSPGQLSTASLSTETVTVLQVSEKQLVETEPPV